MFDVVCLASGGLDSSVCLKLFQQQGLSALPVFINYGQRNLEFELASLQANCQEHQFHPPVIFQFPSFGNNIATGLTSDKKHVVEDAFTPNRNLMFLTIAAGLAYDRGCDTVALGFLTADSVIFPDQTDSFLEAAESMLSISLGVTMKVVCPLRDMSKQDVVRIAKEVGIDRHYSCHIGGVPCGQCIACLEYGVIDG